MTKEQPKGVSILICYTHEDRILWNKLHKHLVPLTRLKHIVMCYEVEIKEDTKWIKQCVEMFSWSSIILFLISSDFKASHSCNVVLQEAAKRSSIHVVPVILRPTDCEDTPISGLEMLPSGAKPVTTWLNLDEAFLDVARGVRWVVASLLTGVISSIRLFRQETSTPVPFFGKKMIELSKECDNDQYDVADDILQFCEQGILLDPYNVIFYKMKTKILLKLYFNGLDGFLEGLGKICEEAVQKFPDELYFRDIMTTVYFERIPSIWYDRVKDQKEYEQMLQVNPGCLDLYLKRAQSLRSMGRYEEAIVVYRQVFAFYHEGHVHSPKNKVIGDRTTSIFEEIPVIYAKEAFIYSNFPYLDEIIASEYRYFEGILSAIGKYEEASIAYEQAKKIEVNLGFSCSLGHKNSAGSTFCGKCGEKLF